jgi:hypothetical protein
MPRGVDEDEPHAAFLKVVTGVADPRGMKRGSTEEHAYNFSRVATSRK